MLFLHNTSRVEGEPYPTLLKDKGFRGFPSLAFMDHEGEVLASVHYTRRAVAEFDKMHAALLFWRANKGITDPTPEMAIKLFLAELDLGRLKADEAKARLAKLEGIDADSRKAIEQQIIDLECGELLSSVRQLGRDTVQERLAQMAAQKRIPSGASARNFWMYVMNHHHAKEDLKATEHAFAELMKVAGEGRRAEAMKKHFEKRLAELREKKKGG